MQSKVADGLRAGGSAYFGEHEMEEELLDSVRKGNLPEEVVQEQGKFTRASRFI